MKLFKLSSIILFSFLFMWVCTPELSARTHDSRKYHYHKHSYRSKSRSSKVALNLNLTPTPNYVGYSYPYPAPAYVVAPSPVVEQHVYYPSYYAPQPAIAQPSYYAPQPMVVQPSYRQSVYVQPSYSYWRY